MPSISETGHAVNIENFKVMIDRCTAFGTEYDPSNTALTIVNMTSQYDAVRLCQKNYLDGLEVSRTKINDHDLLYQPLNLLITHVINVLQSTEVSKPFIRDAKALADVIRGANLNPRTKKDGTPDLDHISNSHQSFVMRADNFEKLVFLLKAEPKYTPNENDLKATSLESYKDQLIAANSDLFAQLAPVMNDRIARNHLLYDPDTGVVDTAKKVKKYVRGHFGPRTPEAKSITSIKFTLPRKNPSHKKKKTGNDNPPPPNP